MRYSYVSYTGNGSVKQFSVPFSYINKDHVSVTVDGASAPFTWFNATTVQVTTTPPNGSVVKIKRVTPKDVPLADFNDASTLTETALDLATTQNLYVAQEGDDKAEDIKQEAIDAAVGAAGLISRAVPFASSSDVGKVLTAGAGDTYGWVDAGWKLLSATSFTSAQSSVIFALPAAYSRFRLEWQDMSPAADAGTILRFSFDSGATYKQGASDYTTVYQAFTGSGPAAGVQTTNAVVLTGTVQSGTQSFGAIEFSNVTVKQFTASSSYITIPGPAWSFFMAGGRCDASAAKATNVLLAFGGGVNISAGSLRILGIA